MKLSKYLRRYLSERVLTPKSVENYRTSVAMLDRWHGRPVKLKHLSDELLNRFLSWYLEASASRDTVKTRRTCLLAIIRAAADSGLTAYEPRKVKSIRCPRPVVDVWTPAEMRALIEACRLLVPTVGRC